jgi:hypothetical protein
MIQASYLVILFIHSNCNLTEIGYYFFYEEIITAPTYFLIHSHSNYNLTEIGYYFFYEEIIIAPTLFPDTFTALSKYKVHLSFISLVSSTISTSSSGRSKFNGS